MQRARQIFALILTAFVTFFGQSLLAQEKAASQVLFKNVNIFDGTSDQLAKGQDVLVQGNLIKQIGRNLTADAEASVIDGGGRTLLPGFIDNHVHPPA